MEDLRASFYEEMESLKSSFLQELEELDDIRAYDQARKDDSEPLCFEEAVSEIEKTEDEES